MNAGAIGRLRRFRPHVVLVGGWNQPAFWQAAAWARVARRPLVVWVESTARDERSGAAPLELAKRTMLRAAAGFVVPGKAAAEYLATLGARPEQIVVAPNAADPSLVEGAPPRSEARAELGVDGCVFLCVSRLSPEKGVDVLARAFDGVPGELVLVGDGPDRDDLLRWYAAADAFVMPSRYETWGMAMQEAATAGLPLIASEAPGAGYDLIEEGVNGYRVPVEDVDALREALARVADDPGWRERAGRRTRELTAGHTPAAWAEAVARFAASLA